MLEICEEVCLGKLPGVSSAAQNPISELEFLSPT